QVQLASGHALDANLQLGTGGYNGRVYSGNPVTSLRYAPGVVNTTAYDSTATRAVVGSNFYTWSPANTFNQTQTGALSASRPYRPGGYPTVAPTQQATWVGTV